MFLLFSMFYWSQAFILVGIFMFLLVVETGSYVSVGLHDMLFIWSDAF